MPVIINDFTVEIHEDGIAFDVLDRRFVFAASGFEFKILQNVF